MRFNTEFSFIFSYKNYKTESVYEHRVDIVCSVNQMEHTDNGKEYIRGCDRCMASPSQASHEMRNQCGCMFCLLGMVADEGLISESRRQLLITLLESAMRNMRLKPGEMPNITKSGNIVVEKTRYVPIDIRKIPEISDKDDSELLEEEHEPLLWRCHR